MLVENVELNIDGTNMEISKGTSLLEISITSSSTSLYP